MNESEKLPLKMKITMELANEILGYLGRQPYEQVFQLIAKIQDAHRENFTPQATAVPMDATQPPAAE